MSTFFKLLLCLNIFLLAGSASAQETVESSPEQTTELWEGKALTANFRVGICYRPDGRAQGVLLLKHRSGQEDVYHLYGTVKNNEFYLSHSSGHKLSGSLTGPESMQGKAKLKSGLTLKLSGKRQRDVRLSAADCAPLPR